MYPPLLFFMAVFGLGVMALTSCEEHNPPEQTSTTQSAQSPQQASTDLCERDNLDTMCSVECGDIIIEPVGALAGCDSLATGFSYPNVDGCNEEPKELYCIKLDDPDLRPCDRHPDSVPQFPCGQCVDSPEFDQQQKEDKFDYFAKSNIGCKCCNGEVVCGEVDIFQGKNVTGNPNTDKTTTFQGPVPNPVGDDCCNGDGYKIIYDASKSIPSKDIYYYKLKCL